jgi:hypothetical protein
MISLINFFSYDKEEDKIIHLIQVLKRILLGIESNGKNQ